MTLAVKYRPLNAPPWSSLIAHPSFARAKLATSQARRAGLQQNRTVRQDMAAVTNAFLEHWSNGQAEGQINRLKMLKRAMYGRAGAELLRARMFPLVEVALQRD
jgi:hypothetical protein